MPLRAEEIAPQFRLPSRGARDRSGHERYPRRQTARLAEIRADTDRLGEKRHELQTTRVGDGAVGELHVRDIAYRVRARAEERVFRGWHGM